MVGAVRPCLGFPYSSSQDTKKTMTKTLPLSALLCCLAIFNSAPCHAQVLELDKGDHICLVGNELGERMQHHNYWETLLHHTFADKQLAVRNLCFPGDEPFIRLRSKNFGTPESHLRHSQADVILYFFGFNESFAGAAGLSKFGEELRRLVDETKAQDFSGKGSPRIVLVSPIAFENTGDRNLPNGIAQNQRLAAYTKAMSSVAKVTGVGFVDLFTPTKQLFEESDKRLTLNGAHLNESGYQALAPILMKGLFGTSPSNISRDLAKLKREIDDKNFHWWHRYRAVNGFSIYGDRGLAGSDGTYNNRDVMEREREILDQMTANRDQRIWAIAQGESVPNDVDDSNTLPFIEPRTNVGGPDDKQAKLGKLGSLDYLNAEEQQKLFKLAAGYEINLVASEEQFPELANPVAIDFDNSGRLWVATMESYPHWKPKTVLDDKLLILEDKDHDGRADECKVFAGGLHQPTGFEIGRGGVYVAQQPDILFLQDTDGDDRADVRIRKLVGFDSADSHHGIAAFTWGPGGNLYFNEGTFKFSQVESPYGLTRMHEAGIWKYDPRTEKFGAHVSFAFSNPWGHVFDRWGQDFIADASPGFSYWAAPISGHIEYPLKHPGGSQHKRIAKETGGDPNYQFPTFYPKRIRPSAACELVSSRHFPPEAQGNFLLTNCIGDRAVLNHEMSEDGTGFKAEEVTPLVYCEDGNFRPIDIQFAPDGSLYIVDWHNALIGHLQHNLRDPSRDHSHGRIWRVTYKGRPLVEPPKVAGAEIADLLELLKEPEDRTRYVVRRELAERDTDAVIGATQTWAASLDTQDEDYEHNLLEALWVYQTHNVVEPDLLKKLLNADDYRARAAAVRVLSFWLDQVDSPLELLRARIADPNSRVRLEAVRAISFLKGDDAAEVALDVLNYDMDDYLQYTLDETMRALEQ
jgi:putative membrane-bound dehydrogenase-like protein